MTGQRAAGGPSDRSGEAPEGLTVAPEAGEPAPVEPEPVERLEATVHGRVQGVGFRYFVVRRALELDVVGWVANTPDGSVSCVAEGSPDALDAFESTLRVGPLGAIVESVSAVRMPGTGRFDRFAIRSGAHSGD